MALHPRHCCCSPSLTDSYFFFVFWSFSVCCRCDCRCAVISHSILIILCFTILTSMALISPFLIISNGLFWMPIAAVSGMVAPLTILPLVTNNFLICCVFGIGFGVFQLVGAIHYNVRMLVTCLIFHLFSLALGLRFLLFVYVLVGYREYGLFFCPLFSLLWIYHVANLIKEIRKPIHARRTASSTWIVDI